MPQRLERAIGRGRSRDARFEAQRLDLGDGESQAARDDPEKVLSGVSEPFLEELSKNSPCRQRGSARARYRPIRFPIHRARERSGAVGAREEEDARRAGASARRLQRRCRGRPGRAGWENSWQVWEQWKRG